MKRVVFIILITLLSNYCLAQSFNVRNIFNSGATIGAEHIMPASINDSINFQLIKYKIQFVKVLRTKEVDIEKFDMENKEAKANQLFLTSKFSVTKPSLSHQNYFKNIYNGELELTYITVSRKRGVWLHAANVSATESEESIKHDFTPNFRAYSVYAHINPKNLDFIPFVGPGIALNQGRILALPVFGFWTKLSPQLSFEIIAPIHIKLKYNLANKVEFELATSYNRINAVYREGSKYKGNDNTINLRQLKSHLGINTRLSEYYKVKFEMGYAVLQELNGLSNDYSKKMNPTPYFNISFNYNFRNSILYKFFNEGDKLGKGAAK
ncbi:MAG: hypothetical protein H6587_01305 [Flavobacteriales bacterium]|nr:hypothetical protein [Flavobacteriales bacterium]MCB9363182.1 hypothetical protein [Flavobacteriales bacterium]